MALIDNNGSLVIDATLTKKGRELLSSGNGNFNITKFAVSDDEIDYSITENDILTMALREASINGDVELKNKLISNTNSTTLVMTSITNVHPISTEMLSNEDMIIEPQTANGGDAAAGYIISVSNANDTTYPAASIVVLEGVPSLGGNTQYTAVGRKFKIVADVVTETQNAEVRIVGRETGAMHTFTIEIAPNPATQQQQS